MKKLLLLAAVLGFGGFLWAAGLPANTPISVLTLTQVAQSTPTYTGQVVVCSNCVSQNSGVGTLCVSSTTANAQNAYIIAGSSQATTTTCK